MENWDTLSFLIGLAIGIAAAFYCYVRWQKNEAKLDGAYDGWDSSKSALTKVAKEKEVQSKLREDAEKDVERIKTQLSELRKYMDDKEKIKEEMQKSAESAMLKTGTDALKKEVKEINEKFSKMHEGFASLNSQVIHHGNKVETVWKSLSTPSAAGQFSELGLESTLTSFGLKRGRDFILQYGEAKDIDTGGNLRPDAVIFLPHGDLLVVDCKASKFFLELAQTEGAERENEVKEKLKKTMRDHIKALSIKGYKDAIRNLYKTSGRSEDIGNIYTIMYLLSDTHREKLSEIDPEFDQRCKVNNIKPAGPTGLNHLIDMSTVEINKAEQDKESKAIIDQLGSLLDSIEIVIRSASGVGKGILSAAKHFQAMSKSINSNLLPKAKKIADQGRITLPKNKSLPKDLPFFHVDESPVIEGDSEEVEKEIKQLEEVL